MTVEEPGRRGWPRPPGEDPVLDSMMELLRCAALGLDLVEQAAEADRAMERVPDLWHERAAQLRRMMEPFISPTAWRTR